MKVQKYRSPLTPAGIAFGRARSGSAGIQNSIPPHITARKWAHQGRLCCESASQGQCRAVKRIRSVIKAKVKKENRNYQYLSPILTKNVIYVVYNINFNRLYVGRTNGTAFNRFKQHVRAARSSGINQHNDYPLSRCIARSNWEDFRTIPVERIDDEGKFPDHASYIKYANKRERSWMRRLQTQFPEHGWNIVSTKRRNRKVGNANPMKWRRVRPGGPGPIDEFKEMKHEDDGKAAEANGVVKAKGYDQLDRTTRRLQHLARLMDCGHFSAQSTTQFSTTQVCRMVSKLDALSPQNLQLDRKSVV